MSRLRKLTAGFTGPHRDRGRRMCRAWVKVRSRRPRADRSVALKYHPEPQSTSPNDAALLFHAAIEELESVRHRSLAADFETRAAGGVIDDRAGHDRVLATDDDRSGPGHLTRRDDSVVQARVRHLLLLLGVAPSILPVKL